MISGFGVMILGVVNDPVVVLETMTTSHLEGERRFGSFIAGWCAKNKKRTR